MEHKLFVTSITCIITLKVRQPRVGGTAAITFQRIIGGLLTMRDTQIRAIRYSLGWGMTTSMYFSNCDKMILRKGNATLVIYSVYGTKKISVQKLGQLQSVG